MLFLSVRRQYACSSLVTNSFVSFGLVTAYMQHIHTLEQTIKDSGSTDLGAEAMQELLHYQVCEALA